MRFEPVSGITTLAALILTLFAFPASAKPAGGMSERDIDQLVERAMQTFTVPGVALGVIKDGKVIYAKGFGVREAGKPGKVDSETLFAIASNSKAFTTAALALLVDDGKITWDDKVIDYIPEFRLSDPWVTREFTIRDLVVHRSGLGLGAGDLMFWPSSGFSRKEIIANLRHLKPVSSFRTEYAYDNLLYIVAGEMIPAVTGQSYEDFVDARILAPLNMQHCAANRARLKDEQNIAEPHAVIDGKLQRVDRLEAVHERAIIAAAGGLQCSVDSMLRWVAMHLRGGEYPDGGDFLSTGQHEELWSPQTILKVSDNDKSWYNTQFAAYGLGWGLKDIHGYKWVSHTGGLLGMVTFVSMVPELNLGVVVLTNQQSGSAMRAIMSSIMTAYMPVERRDWIKKHENYANESKIKAQKEVDTARSEANQQKVASMPLSVYTGTYRDPWFGDIVVSVKNNVLYFKSLRSEKLEGPMEHFNQNSFIVRWTDRSLEADAYVLFGTDVKGNAIDITMKAVSPLTDFSFDFHDLNFTRVD